jgi:hypothetical protein
MGVAPQGGIGQIVAWPFAAGLARVSPTLAHVASGGAEAGKTPTTRDQRRLSA